MDVTSIFTSNRRTQKVAYKGFQYTKERDTNTDTGMKIYWRCENRKCKQFIFFYTNQFSSEFRRNSTKFQPIVVVHQTSESAKRRIDQMWHWAKRCFDEMVFDQLSWIQYKETALYMGGDARKPVFGVSNSKIQTSLLSYRD